MSKRKGTASEITEKRDAELLRLLHQANKMVYADKSKQYTVLDVYDLMSTLPCNGFHISEDMAWRYISARRKGKTPSMKCEKKRILYERLYDIVSELRIRADYVAVSTQALMYRAMTMRAPCIGLSPAAIRREIERINKQKKDARRRQEPGEV